MFNERFIVSCNHGFKHGYSCNTCDLEHTLLSCGVRVSVGVCLSVVSQEGQTVPVGKTTCRNVHKAALSNISSHTKPVRLRQAQLLWSKATTHSLIKQNDSSLKVTSTDENRNVTISVHVTALPVRRFQSPVSLRAKLFKELHMFQQHNVKTATQRDLPDFSRNGTQTNSIHINTISS